MAPNTVPVMRQNVMTVTEKRLENITGNELAEVPEILAQLSGRPVEVINHERVQTTLVAMRMMGHSPEDR